MDFLTVPFMEAANDLLRAKLDDFAHRNNEEAVLQQIDWGAYWRELVNVTFTAGAPTWPRWVPPGWSRSWP